MERKREHYYYKIRRFKRKKYKLQEEGLDVYKFMLKGQKM